MKKLFAILGLVALCAFSAQAQYKQSTLISGGTNNVAAAATNTYTADIAAPESEDIGLLLSFKCSGANTGQIVFTLKPVDPAGNVSTVSAQWLTIPVTANGTTTVNYITNVAVNGLYGYRLTSVGNTNESVFATNVTAKAITKYGL